MPATRGFFKSTLSFSTRTLLRRLPGIRTRVTHPLIQLESTLVTFFILLVQRPCFVEAMKQTETVLFVIRLENLQGKTTRRPARHCFWSLQPRLNY